MSNLPDTPITLISEASCGDSSARVRSDFIPWYLWVGVIAVTCSSIGGAWDFAWHRSIGRDGFWTAPHMAIYACAVLAAFVSVRLTVEGTLLSGSGISASSVAVFGLRAPLGAFLTGWGGLAMLASAPFDYWWHSAYGLDVTIVSPPHALLVLGARAISVGVLLLVLAAMNRALEGEASNLMLLRILFFYLCGDAVGSHMFFLQQYTSQTLLHGATAYIAMGIAIPILLAMAYESTSLRWAATISAAVYTYLVVAEILSFPLFPAHPKLGPVYYPVTHLVPSEFPILLLGPAYALDIVWQRTRGWRLWQTALLSGVVFVATLTALEWPFARFLMSHASENRLFGTIYFGYSARPDSYERMRIFLMPEHGLTLMLGLLLATICAVLSTWIGLSFGRWMRGVKR